MRVNQYNVQVFLTEEEEQALAVAVRNMVSIQLGQDVPNKKQEMLIYRPVWRFINEMLRERERNANQ